MTNRQVSKECLHIVKIITIMIIIIGDDFALRFTKQL